MTMDEKVPAGGGARERLIDAAELELVEGGLEGLSLRGIARRAEVSHAAPKYFFGDRAGLLTAVAAEGFAGLADALRAAVAAAGEARLGVLGRAYVAYGLENPALFDLMFRPGELHADDPHLRAAQTEAIGILSRAVAAHPSQSPPAGTPALALVSWAFVHGLVVLTRDGALQGAADGDASMELLEELIAAFERVVP